MPSHIDRKDLRFNDWTIIEDLGKACKAQCICGGVHVRAKADITSGRSNRCRRCASAIAAQWSALPNSRKQALAHNRKKRERWQYQAIWLMLMRSALQTARKMMSDKLSEHEIAELMQTADYKGTLPDFSLDELGA